MFSQFVKNDIEESFSYLDKDELRTNLSMLVASGDDPAHLSIAKYKDGQDEPVLEIKLYKEEQKLLKALLL